MWLWRLLSVNEKGKLEVRYSYRIRRWRVFDRKQSYLCQRGHRPAAEVAAAACGTEAASTEAGRLLWLCLIKRTKPGPLLLLAKRTKPYSSSDVSRSQSTTESRLCGLCCGLDLAEQAPAVGGYIVEPRAPAPNPPAVAVLRFC